MDSYGNPGSQHRCQPVWNSYQNSIYTATAVYPHTMAGVHGCVPGCIDPRTIERVYFTRIAGGWENSPTQTGSGAMAAGRGESPEPDVLALILSPSSSDEEPD